MKEEKLIKNQECASCKKMFECKGKPRETKACVNYEKRKVKGEEDEGLDRS